MYNFLLGVVGCKVSYTKSLIAKERERETKLLDMAGPGQEEFIDDVDETFDKCLDCEKPLRNPRGCHNLYRHYYLCFCESCLDQRCATPEEQCCPF